MGECQPDRGAGMSGPWPANDGDALNADLLPPLVAHSPDFI